VYAFIALSIIAAPLMMATAEESSPLVEKASAPAQPPAVPAGVIFLDEYGNKIKNTPEVSVAKKATPDVPETQKPSTDEPVLETSVREEKQALTAPVGQKLPMEEAVPGIEPSEMFAGQSDVQGEVAESALAALESETAVEETVEDPVLTLEPSMSDIETAWFTTSGGILLRGDEVLAQRGENGLRNIDGLARAILLSASPEQMIQIAGLASQMAPDLPYARMEAARALRVREGWSYEVAIAYAEVFKAIGRNLEASLWLEAFVLRLLGWMLALGSMAYLLLVALRYLPLAIHDFSDLAPMKVPMFSAVAMLGFFILLPAALGEGALGVVFILFVVCVCYAGMKQRIALCAAAVSLLIAIHGLGFAADVRLEALNSHSLVKLVNTAFQGMLEPGEVVRLRAAAISEEDPAPLAREAYAGWLAREGRLEEANALYDQLVEEESSRIPVYLLNNAANVKIRLKKLPEAITLYQQAEAFITAGFGAPS
jgi:tetratricopeptide (TPR) repeat protein